MTQLPQPRTSTPQLHPHIAGKVRQLAPVPATRILDLGCGSGALLERLAAMGYRDLTGVDIRPPASGGKHHVLRLNSSLAKNLSVAPTLLTANR